MEEKLTVEQVLQDAVNTLNNIQLPIALIETAGNNIFRVARNLQQCLVAINEAKEKEEPAEK